MISLVGNHSPLVGKPKPSAIAYGNGKGHAADHRLNAAPDALVWRPPRATAAWGLVFGKRGQVLAAVEAQQTRGAVAIGRSRGESRRARQRGGDGG